MMTDRDKIIYLTALIERISIHTYYDSTCQFEYFINSTYFPSHGRRISLLQGAVWKTSYGRRARLRQLTIEECIYYPDYISLQDTHMSCSEYYRLIQQPVRLALEFFSKNSIIKITNRYRADSKQIALMLDKIYEWSTTDYRNDK